MSKEVRQVGVVTFVLTTVFYIPLPVRLPKSANELSRLVAIVAIVGMFGAPLHAPVFYGEHNRGECLDRSIFSNGFQSR